VGSAAVKEFAIRVRLAVTRSVAEAEDITQDAFVALLLEARRWSAATPSRRWPSSVSFAHGAAAREKTRQLARHVLVEKYSQSCA